MTPVAHAIVAAAYVIAISVLALLGLHRMWMMWLYRCARVRERLRAIPPLPVVLPRVTVQLPLFNEFYVAERAIRALAALDYPRDLLEVQVLDDSTDATREVVDRAAVEATARGVAVSVLRRDARHGFKAGALAAGLAQARGELIAVFDADFVPPRDWLRRIVGEFSDPRAGMVQTAWGHLNADASPLTRAQADFLQGHFAIEHRARAGNGHFFNFNGTAGIWRRRAIEDAGGWSADTLTEDLDLSYRAQLAGWRFVYRPDVVVPAELPEEFAAFKKQQHRWTKGAIEVAWKILPRLLRTPGLSPAIRFQGAAHLLCNLAYPAMLLLALVTLPVMLLRQAGESGLLPWLDLAILAVATGSVGAFSYTAQRLEGKQRLVALGRIPLLMAFGIALAINNSRAVAEGLLRIRSPFRRTAKYGTAGDETGGTRGDWKGRRYNGRLDTQALIEVAAGLYALGVLATGVLLTSSLSWPFLALLATGFTLGPAIALGQALGNRCAAHAAPCDS